MDIVPFAWVPRAHFRRLFRKLTLAVEAEGAAVTIRLRPTQPRPLSTQCFATQTVYVVFNTVTHVVSITGTWSLASTGSLFNGCVGFLTCQNYQLSVWDDRGYSHLFGTGLGCNGGSYSTSWSDFTDTWTWAHGSVSATYSGICGIFLCHVTDTAQADVYVAS